MPEDVQSEAELRQLQEAVRRTVAAGRDLQSRVSELVFSALSTATASFDPEQVRRVARAALDGVSAGAQPSAVAGSDYRRQGSRSRP
jgi:ApbE superfamily uncharacterized protein (UPF0280 family)